MLPSKRRKSSRFMGWASQQGKGRHWRCGHAPAPQLNESTGKAMSTKPFESPCPLQIESLGTISKVTLSVLEVYNFNLCTFFSKCRINFNVGVEEVFVRRTFGKKKKPLLTMSFTWRKNPTIIKILLNTRKHSHYLRTLKIKRQFTCLHCRSRCVEIQTEKWGGERHLRYGCLLDTHYLAFYSTGRNILRNFCKLFYDSEA